MVGLPACLQDYRVAGWLVSRGLSLLIARYWISFTCRKLSRFNSIIWTRDGNRVYLLTTVNWCRVVFLTSDGRGDGSLRLESFEGM